MPPFGWNMSIDCSQLISNGKYCPTFEASTSDTEPGPGSGVPCSFQADGYTAYPRLLPPR